METRQFWYMQMEPRRNDIHKFSPDKIFKILVEEGGVIGLSSEQPEVEKFRETMKVGDIVAIRSQAKPVALVEVIGDWKRVSEKETDKDFDWFNIRRDISILDYYKEGEDNFSISAPGTLVKCRNDSAIGKMIVDWYNRVKPNESTDIEITVEQYQNAIQNALTPKQMAVLQALYDFPNSTATAKELAAKLNYESYHPANRQIGAIGEAIAKYNNIDVIQHYYYIDRGEKKPSYFYVVGPYYKERGWEMWNNLRSAIKNTKRIEPVASHYYIQYHNADKLGRYPTSRIDINTPVDSLTLHNTIKYGPQIYTSKKQVEKTIGQSCFLIVGKTDIADKIKKYYLWSFFKIEDLEMRDNVYAVKGTGFDIEKPILLNELEHFNDFKDFCGNFGLGFQNIDNHIFCQTLINLTGKNKDLKIIAPMNEPKNLNVILYGPPGTGKTYNTIEKAIAIANPRYIFPTNPSEKEGRKLVKAEYERLCKVEQISFVTFHQSMSYEDFIEGIKPIEPKPSDAYVSYKIVDGIFKSLCNRAKEKKTSKNFDEAYEKFVSDIEEKGLELETPTLKKHFDVRINENSSCVAIPQTETATNMVLTKELIRDYIVNDVIRDWKPYLIPIGEYIKEKYEVDIQEEDNSRKNFVLIIDEINRGNISQIFGELITLIEEDKREGRPEALEVILPYSKKPFSVPPNLYIIGTMNTADRSVEALDTALRRRFSFEEIQPDSSLIENNVAGIDLAEVLTVINRRIEKLLDKDHLIGHSYFMSVTDIDGLKSVFQHRINPLLQEYFFGDFGKIGLVIGAGFFKNEGNQEKEDGEIFAKFDKYGESSDLAERPVYQLENVIKMDNEDFKKAINKLLNR